ncbi:universal stress protein [Streptomyces mashuensis]|uniref:Universal stress protein n=1 Tax=Streptomyces mashuensis TaxID=33904 RepID=A0A919B6H4_9ACTN|nr:universal stress protein [Streptomyces mashuensis]GHF55679.1 universal stress protein [Streptomyces mashuensis]
MPGSVTGTISAGLDGTGQGLAAADWAAREAVRRGAALRLVHAWVWQPLDVPIAADATTQRHWAEEVLRHAERRVAMAHPGLTVTARLLPEDTVTALVAEAGRADLLVLGSRGHGALVGHLVGSVALHVLRRATAPVVLVREPREAGGEDTAAGEVVVGVQDLDADSNGPVLEFAFAAAEARGARLRAVRAWTLPPVLTWGPGSLWLADEAGEMEPLERKQLADAVRPWRDRHPHVDVAEDVGTGSAGQVLLDHTGAACLLVVGRRLPGPHGLRRLGSVAYAALHHAPCPVAVVPHP